MHRHRRSGARRYRPRKKTWLTSNTLHASRHATDVRLHAITVLPRAWRSRIQNRWSDASASTSTARRYADSRRASWRAVASSRVPFALRAPTCVRPAATSVRSTRCSTAASVPTRAAVAPTSAGVCRRRRAAAWPPNREEDVMDLNQTAIPAPGSARSRASCAQVPTSSSVTRTGLAVRADYVSATPVLRLVRGANAQKRPPRRIVVQNCG